MLIAKTMGPAELLDYDRKNLRAVVLGEGAPSAHVSIVARALEIPMVGKLAEGVDQIQPGDELIVDADNGQVHVNPGADIAQSYHETMAARAPARRRIRRSQGPAGGHAGRRCMSSSASMPV